MEFLILLLAFVVLSGVNCRDRNNKIRAENKADGGNHKVLRVVRSWKDATRYLEEDKKNLSH